MDNHEKTFSLPAEEFDLIFGDDMSDTPRTDAFSNPSTEGDEDLFVLVATYNALLESHGQLERELAKAIKERDEASEHVKNVHRGQFGAP